MTTIARGFTVTGNHWLVSAHVWIALTYNCAMKLYRCVLHHYSNANSNRLNLVGIATTEQEEEDKYCTPNSLCAKALDDKGVGGGGWGTYHEE